MYILINHSAEYIVYKPLKAILMLFGKISVFREFVETKKNKSYEQHIEDSFNYNRMFFDKDVCNFGHFQTGWLFGPMACGFWIDLAIIPFLIFERNVLPYPFKGGNLIIFAAVFGILSFIMIFRDERCQRVVKEYRKKPRNEQRKAFYLFIGMYILVIIPIFLLFQYERKKNGW